jgi:hypothetical protein
MIKIPCEECISFAICKQRIREELEPSDLTTFGKWINCDSVNKYIDKVKTELSGNERTLEVLRARKVFGLPELPKLREYRNRPLVVVNKRN